MDWIAELKQRLAEGLYLHNLQQITESCDRGLKDGQGGLPAYVVRSVVADLAREWEGRAVSVDEARRLEAALRPALDGVVGALERHESPEAVAARLDTLVRAWLAS